MNSNAWVTAPQTNDTATTFAAVRPTDRGGVRNPDRQGNEQEGGAPQAGVVRALRDAPKGVHKPVSEEQSPEAEADEDVVPEEVRRQWRSEPHESDVHHRVEGQRNWAGRIRRKANLLADHFLD